MQPLDGPLGEVVLAPRPTVPGGVLAERPQLKMDQLVGAWLLSKKSTNTREAYYRDLRAFADWIAEHGDRLGVVHVLQCQRWHLDAYREFLQEGEHQTRYHGRRSYSDATVARKLTVISSFYAYCVEEAPHLVPTNPMRRVERPEATDDSSTPSLSLADARRLLDAARRSGPMAHSLVGLLLTTGMRISEAVKVDTGDLDIENGQRIVWVRRKGGKRTKLVVPAEIAHVIDRHRRGRRGALFLGSTGNRLLRQQVDRILARLVRDAGIVDEAAAPITLTPHMLRHTAATIALDAGRDLVDVQEMLGHRDPKTTRRYIANRDKLQNSAVHTVAALLGADHQPDDGMES